MSNNFEIDEISLLKAIANKAQDYEMAQKCFHIFISSFEADLLKFADIHASKMKFSSETAFAAVECAFAKVWKYPTFDMRKSHCKDVHKAILIWLKQIVASQMYEYLGKGRCTHLSEEEDLSVIEDASSFIDVLIGDTSPQKKIEYITTTERIISCLDEKHRIIYLTYKAYENIGKRLPQTLLAKLRNRLQLTQATIRVYKKEAQEAIQIKLQ